MILLIKGRITMQLSDDEVMVVLPELTKQIGMTSVGPVHIQHFDLPQHQGLGISAVQFLAESHILLHYYTNEIGINIFSCKDIPVSRAVRFCYKTFHIRPPREFRVILWDFEREVAHAKT